MRTAGRGELLIQQVGRGEGGMLGKNVNRSAAGRE